MELEKIKAIIAEVLNIDADSVSYTHLRAHET